MKNEEKRKIPMQYFCYGIRIYCEYKKEKAVTMNFAEKQIKHNTQTL